MGVGKLDPLFRHPVEIRRLVASSAVAAQAFGSQIVGQDQNDVGPVVCIVFGAQIMGGQQDRCGD